MAGSIALYTRYIGASFKSQMAYKASFVLSALGHFLVTGIEFIGMLVLFDRFRTLGAWTLPEVAFLYGLVNVAFAFADAAVRGFDMFGPMVKSGDFDRILLRPRSTVLQLLGQELTLRRIGRLAQGLAVLLWASNTLDVSWDPGKVLLALAAIVGGAALFSGLVVLQATMAFWTTETLEIVNSVTYGGVQATQYPVSLYRDWFQRFLVYVIPLAFVNYFPAMAILERPDPLGSSLLVQYASPLVGLLFFAFCLQVWKLGVRHYRSTGS